VQKALLDALSENNIALATKLAVEAVKKPKRLKSRPN